MAFRPPPRSADFSDAAAASAFGGLHAGPSHVAVGPATTEDALRRCSALLAQLPPMEGSIKYRRAWSIEESLEQYQCLMRQHEQQTSIGQNHAAARKTQIQFLQLVAEDLGVSVKQAINGGSVNGGLSSHIERLGAATRNVSLALRQLADEEQQAAEKGQRMEAEILKCNREMVVLKEAIDDVSKGGGPTVVGLPAAAPLEVDGERKYFYCSDCHVGGHGQRFCNYLLQRPNWRVYPSEKWFEDKGGQISFCPLGRHGVDFTDETYFSTISMHIKGRIWLEDKRKLYEFVPDLMPLTFVISDQKWIGPTPPDDELGAPPMPWFVKGTDRNFGTSVFLCAHPQDCMGLAKANEVYVVQKHIANPLLYDNGEKCHIKFYNLLIGMEDGITWHLYTYRDGYLCIAPKKWSPEDLSKEGQVTIVRTKRIMSWPYWETVYAKCQQCIKSVIERAAAQGKLEGRNKRQFEIISADFVATENLDVFLLEFNTGPVLKDPDDSPDVHDAGMVGGALHIVHPWEGGDNDLWDFVVECKGQPPKGDEQPGSL